jgi:hypothetical protein
MTDTIARYLTVGGGTVDLTHRLNALNPPTPISTVASCTGCSAAEERSHWVGVCVDIHQPDAADTAARKWAQSHAETCRAMPMPEGGW